MSVLYTVQCTNVLWVSLNSSIITLRQGDEDDPSNSLQLLENCTPPPPH